MQILDEEIVIRDMGDYCINILRRGRNVKLDFTWPHSKREVGDRYCHIKIEYYPFDNHYQEQVWLAETRNRISEELDNIFEQYGSID
jgi:hypothetical protein